MDTRVAVLSIIVEDYEAANQLNELLHEYGQYIIGRMGIPYREKKINVICVTMDAPMDKINALSGAIGRIPEINAKVIYAKQHGLDI